jgi:hypothetical protein
LTMPATQAISKQLAEREAGLGVAVTMPVVNRFLSTSDRETQHGAHGRCFTSSVSQNPPSARRDDSEATGHRRLKPKALR